MVIKEIQYYDNDLKSLDTRIPSFIGSRSSKWVCFLKNNIINTNLLGSSEISECIECSDSLKFMEPLIISWDRLFKTWDVRQKSKLKKDSQVSTLY